MLPLCFARFIILIFTTLGGLSTLALSGDLDQSFGKDGKIITDFFGRTDVGKNILIDGNKKILISGSATKVSTSDHFALARYNDDGSLDASFGLGGKVTTSKIADNKYVSEGIDGLGLQSDGKIVACGRGFFESNSGLALVRYNEDGSLDNSFGTDGVVFTFDAEEQNFPLALAIDATDKIIVVAAAFKQHPESSSFAVFRFNADGSLDNSFGREGRVTTKVAPGNDVPRAVKIDAEGRIIAAGFSGNSKFTVVRYSSQGVLDSSFGQNGIATIVFNAGGTDTLNALAIQADGKIVVGGDVQVGSYAGLRMIDFGLARLSSQGQLDLSFNNTGKQITHFVEPAASSLWALTIQPDGKIIGVGDASLVNGLGVARYNIDGSLDQSFGQAGKQIIPFKGTSHWEGVSLQPDGKIVAGGYIWNGKHYDIGIVRFNN